MDMVKRYILTLTKVDLLKKKKIVKFCHGTMERCKLIMSNDSTFVNCVNIY